jgi:hypothetical protein
MSSTLEVKLNFKRALRSTAALLKWGYQTTTSRLQYADADNPWPWNAGLMEKWQKRPSSRRLVTPILHLTG